MEKQCSICKRAVDSEAAAILTLGGFGNPRYMCSECDSDFEDATRAREIDKITEAMDRIGKKMSESNVDDKLVLKTVKEIMEEAAERGAKIKSGEYDFSLEDNGEALTEEYEVPEELRETEEDKEIERKEAEKNAKFDKISNWICLAVLALALGYVIYRFVSTYFL